MECLRLVVGLNNSLADTVDVVNMPAACLLSAIHLIISTRILKFKKVMGVTGKSEQ